MPTALRDEVRWALRAKARRVALALALEDTEVPHGYWPHQVVAQRGWQRTRCSRGALAAALRAVEERGLLTFRLVSDRDRTHRLTVRLDAQERAAVLDAAAEDFAQDAAHYEEETHARLARVEEAVAALREVTVVPAVGSEGWRVVAERAATLASAALRYEARARDLHARAWYADQRRAGRV